MGIVTKEVKIKLWGKTTKYYNDLGYKGNHGDIISVKVEDLSKGSNVKIEYLCDYCNKEIMTMPYADFVRRTKEVNKMACKNCATQKINEVRYLRYGNSNFTNAEKRHKTCIEKYGESYHKQFMEKAFKTFHNNNGYNFPSQSPEVREKIVESYINHYGVNNPQLSNEVRKRTENTNLERYGCIAPSQNEEIKEKALATNLQKYGVEYAMQLPEIRAKVNETLCKNGTQKISKQQFYLNSLYGGEINYPISYYAVDICFPEENLVIEYDGGGHDLRVTLGRLSKEEFNQKEIKRCNAIKYEGYKIMRIISIKDLLPSDQTLLQMLSDTKQYFSDYPHHSWIEFNIDTSSVRNAEYKDGVSYNYGELRKIKDSDLIKCIA